MRAWSIRTGLVFVLLLGCTSQEYEIEKTQCAAQWYDIIKPNVVQRLETEYRQEKRYSGRKTCVQDAKGVTSCKPVYYEVDIPYQILTKVDLNKPERDARIKACTINACQQKFGNASCDIPTAN